MPLQRVVNVYALSLRLFSMCRTVMVAKAWDDALFLQMMATAVSEFEREMRILKVHDRLKDCVGGVRNAARRAAGKRGNGLRAERAAFSERRA